VSHTLGLVIESLVAVLLMVTIGYCFILNKRLVRLRSDEQSLKATISELITATEIAERAVAGLRETAHECDQTIGDRLRVAESYCTELNRKILASDSIIRQLSRIIAAGRSSESPDLEAAAEPEPEIATPPAPVTAQNGMGGAKSLVAAAQAIAARAGARLNAHAA
jgi:hypothetical protein